MGQQFEAKEQADQEQQVPDHLTLAELHTGVHNRSFSCASDFLSCFPSKFVGDSLYGAYDEDHDSEGAGGLS